MRVKDAIGVQLMVFGEYAGLVDIAECNESGSDILKGIPSTDAAELLAITGNMAAMLGWLAMALPDDKHGEFARIVANVETLKDDGAFDRAVKKVTHE